MKKKFNAGLSLLIIFVVPVLLLLTKSTSVFIQVLFNADTMDANALGAILVMGTVVIFCLVHAEIG